MENLENFLKKMIEKAPHEKEFLQTFDEVLTSIWSIYISNPKYLENKVLERLTEPNRIVQFRVDWKDDKGELQVNKGYRVQFSNALGVYKGGLRFHPSVNLSILKFLGFEQIFKNSLTGLPLGGGKGGSDFDPKGKSDDEVRRFCQAFMQKLFPYIGYDLDVPAGDIGVGGREIHNLYEEYRKLGGIEPGVLTGKAISEGGSEIRTEATGYGLVYFVLEMLKEKRESIEGKKCLVSGSGNVSQYTVEKLIELKAIPLTMSDSDGTIYDKDGIDKEKLAFVMDLKNVKRGRISEYVNKYSSAQYLENKNPWQISADIALPCATQNEIDTAGAQDLVRGGIKIVAEGANMPSTKDAIKLFEQANILFGPSKACNAGGVSVSGLEMEQNAKREHWSREQVDTRLQEIMKNIHDSCVRYGKEGDRINYLNGANIAGFIRVADKMIG